LLSLGQYNKILKVRNLSQMRSRGGSMS